MFEFSFFMFPVGYQEDFCDFLRFSNRFFFLKILLLSVCLDVLCYLFSRNFFVDRRV